MRDATDAGWFAMTRANLRPAVSPALGGHRVAELPQLLYAAPQDGSVISATCLRGLTQERWDLRVDDRSA